MATTPLLLLLFATSALGQWSCGSGFAWSNTSQSCVACVAPLTCAGLPSCSVTTPFPSYWNINNASAAVRALLNSSFPAIVSNQVVDFYGWVGNMPQVTAGGAVVNGGLPQLGNLTLHYNKMRTDFARVLPDVNFSGFCLLDYEYWRADWASTPAQYQNRSLVLASSLYPTLNASARLARAIADFEAAARVFMEGTLTFAKSLRPRCRFGYYGYPRNDFATGGYNGAGAAALVATNNKLTWLFNISDALFPSIYVTSPNRSKFDQQTTLAYVNTTVSEAVRLANGKPVLPYSWYLYNAYPRPASGQWVTLTPSDYTIMHDAAAAAGATGLVVWGGIDGVTFFDNQLLNYVNSTLGPFTARAWDTRCAITPLTVA